MKNRYSGHTTYRTEYHIVWNTKYHRAILNTKMRKYLSDMIFTIIDELPGCEVIDFNILSNHVHMVLVIPPKYTVSKVIGRLKGVTSSSLRKRFLALQEIYNRDNSIWSPGYFVSTIGASEEKIFSYLRDQ